MAYSYIYDLVRADNGELTTLTTAQEQSDTLTLSGDGDGDGRLDHNEQVTLGGTTYSYTGVTYGPEGDAGIVLLDNATSSYVLLTNDGTLGVSTPVGNTDAPNSPSDVPVCFLPGTRIATPDGERAIETLRLGELVTLASGEQKPIRWVGRMTVHLHRFNRHTASPILVKAGALGEGLPRRDLYTSYRHGFALEGSLVIAGLLVNGSSVVQCTDWPEQTVTYYQLEVEGHELMLAEGAPTETFGEDGDNRALFDNAAEHHALYPDAQPIEPMALGRVIVRRQLPRAVTARLAAAAAELDRGSRVA